MEYASIARRFRAYSALAEVGEYGEVLEGGQRYPLFRLTVPGPRWLVITAGFHGEEPAGPLTLAERFEEVAAYARARGVGLRVYPCINPSGFERGTRYNASGEHPNNDFLRYEVAPDVWKDTLRPGESFLRWTLFPGPPKETRALQAELERHPAPVGALDLHQDDYFTRPSFYAYVFGDRAHYLPMVREAAKVTKVAAHCEVAEPYSTDRCGLIWYHDGSVSDYFHRRGVRYNAVVETTTCLEMSRCLDVNMVWVRGMVDRVAEDTSVQPSQK